MADGKELREGDKSNFETLQRAFSNGDVCLVSAKRANKDERVALICAVHREETDFVLSPLAEMVTGNPYEEYELDDD
jgi:hypothetical protein